LLDARNFSLWRLDHGERADRPRLTPIAVAEENRTLRIDDAIAWRDDSLLLATGAGLRTFTRSTGKLSRVDFPEPTRPPTTLRRDGLGRLWLGGGSVWTARGSARALWLIDAEARTLESLDRVPWVGRSEVYALARDPNHPDGVIAALGERGVGFVQRTP
jgi:hypothetical protein